MEYRIDQIIELENGQEYMIIDQGIYSNKNYYLVSKVENGQKLSDMVSIVEESNGELITVKDDKLLKALAKYFDKRIEE